MTGWQGRHRGLHLVLRGLGALLGGTLMASLLSLLTQTFLARSLTAVEYGQLAAILTVANLLSSVACAGVNWLLLQIFGDEGRQAYRWTPALGRLLALSGAFATVMLGAYTLVGSSVSGQAQWLAFLAGLAIVAGQAAVDLGSARLQLERRYGALSLWQAATQALRLLLLCLMVLPRDAPPSLEEVLLLYGLTGMAVAAAGAWLLRPLWSASLALPPDGPASLVDRTAPSLMSVAKLAMPFALMTVFYVLYFQWAVVLLDWQVGGAAAASYNAALLLIAAASMLPQVVYMKFLTPIICRWAVHDRARFGAVFHLGVIAMLATGVAGMLVLGLGSPILIPLLFGDGLPDAVMVLSILSLALPIRFVHASFSATFVSPAEVAQKVGYLGWAALCGILANLALVPVLGLAGAPIAAVLSEAVLLALHVRGMHRLIHGVSIRATFRPATSVSSLRLLMEHGRHAD